MPCPRALLFASPRLPPVRQLERKYLAFQPFQKPRFTPTPCLSVCIAVLSKEPVKTSGLNPTSLEKSGPAINIFMVSTVSFKSPRDKIIVPVSWWATSGRKPEETPSIGQVREPTRAWSRDRKDGTETTPPDSR